MKVPDLKEKCRGFGLKVSGNKQELVSRLQEHLKTTSKRKAPEPKHAAKKAATVSAETPKSKAEAEDEQPLGETSPEKQQELPTGGESGGPDKPDGTASTQAEVSSVVQGNIADCAPVDIPETTEKASATPNTGPPAQPEAEVAAVVQANAADSAPVEVPASTEEVSSAVQADTADCAPADVPMSTEEASSKAQLDIAGTHTPGDGLASTEASKVPETGASAVPSLEDGAEVSVPLVDCTSTAAPPAEPAAEVTGAQSIGAIDSPPKAYGQPQVACVAEARVLDPVTAAPEPSTDMEAGATAVSEVPAEVPMEVLKDPAVDIASEPPFPIAESDVPRQDADDPTSSQPPVDISVELVTEPVVEAAPAAATEPTVDVPQQDEPQPHPDPCAEQVQAADEPMPPQPHSEFAAKSVEEPLVGATAMLPEEAPVDVSVQGPSPVLPHPHM